MLLGEIHHLGHLRFGDLVGEDAAHAHAALVHVQHHAGRILDSHAEEALPVAETEAEDYETINSYAPSDLRGSYTLEQAAGLLNLSLDELYSRLGLVADIPSSTSLSDAAAQMGMGLSDFKHQLFD